MIHPTAIIDSAARVADSAEVGPYSVIGADVEIGANCEIKSHVVINGPAKIGSDNQFFQFSSVGETPQDKKYTGESTLLEIGNNNVIRENVTINRGTVQGGGVTKIGNNNWIMAGVHIAHDCVVGNDNVFANNASLAGHVIVDDYVVLGGFTLVSQFNRLGTHAFSTMGSVISRNVPPYLLVSGYMAKPVGINAEGLRRCNFSDNQIKNIRHAYKLVYRSGLRITHVEEKLKAIDQDNNELDTFIEFLQTQKGGIVR